MRLSTGTAALVLLGSAAALADNARLEAAKRLYQRAELDAAMAELKSAEDSSKDDNDLVQILIYKGLIFAETGQGSQSQESFKRALAMRPWAEVPQDTSPRLAKQFHEARKEVWGSGIKPWPKAKNPGAVHKQPEQPPPAAPPPAAPATPPAATPPEATAPAAPPAVTTPAETAPATPPEATPPSTEPPPATPPGDAPPDVPPSTPEK